MLTTEQKQNYFDTALKHIRKQGKRAMRSDRPTSCAYRGIDGNKCAIGALIPDELYNPEMEGGKGGLLMNKILGGDLTFKDESFFNSMQSKLHDTLPDNSRFQEKLELNAGEFARDWGLKVNG